MIYLLIDGHLLHRSLTNAYFLMITLQKRPFVPLPVGICVIDWQAFDNGIKLSSLRNSLQSGTRSPGRVVCN